MDMTDLARQAWVFLRTVILFALWYIRWRVFGLGHPQNGTNDNGTSAKGTRMKGTERMVCSKMAQFTYG